MILNSKRNSYAFTIVELVVTIMIISILITLGFLSVGEYQKNARDSVRITDLKTLESALGIHYVNSNSYPDPTDFIERKFNGAVVVKEGIVGKSVIGNLSSLSQVVVDPSFNVMYNYSVSADNKTYELGSINEK